jgi:hypothetical protein
MLLVMLPGCAVLAVVGAINVVTGQWSYRARYDVVVTVILIAACGIVLAGSPAIAA